MVRTLVGRDLMLQTIKLGLLPYGAAIRERRPGVIVLVYHRVGGSSGRQGDLPLEMFAWQMRWLKQHCRVISLDDVVTIATHDVQHRHDVVAITFDDGYEEIFTHAFPILAASHLPATVYLSTKFLESGEPFSFERGLQSELQGRPLRWEQVTSMLESGLVQIGAHTHSHQNLTALPPDDVRREIEQANGLIARRLGVDPAHFAYPWGRVSSAAKAVVDGIYRTAAVGGTCKNPYAAIDLHKLRRIPIQRSDGRFFFRLKLGSYLAGEEWLRRMADGYRRGAAPTSVTS